MRDIDDDELSDISRRRVLLSAGAAGAAVSLAGCLGDDDDDEDPDPGAEDEDDEDEAPPEDEIPEGGTLRYGLPEPADSHNYLIASSVYSGVANTFQYDFGIATDPETFEVRPWVFTDWDIEDPESDEPVAVADMRDDLVFNDGVEATVDDMVFSYNYINEHEPGQVTAWQDITGAEHGDEWDIRIHMDGSLSTWETDVIGGVPLFPEHIWSEVGDGWEDYDPFEDDVSYQPGETGAVGTGPGVVTEWRPDTSFEVEFTDESVDREGYEYPLTRQDWYVDHELLTGNGPYLDSVEYLVYGEAEAMNQGLLQGEVDVIYEAQTETVNDAEEDPALNVIEGPDSGLSYADWNHRRPPLNDIALRQAMAMCFDEFFWVEELNEGFVQNGTVPYAPAYPAGRPTAVFEGELDNDHPAINAFSFRAEEEGSPEPDVGGIRGFLESGEIIDGEEGTYVGYDYPGDISGAGSSYSESLHDYSFGDVESELLEDEGIDQELYVDGEPFSEFFDGDIEVLLRPPGDNPDIGEAWFRWAENCRQVGIPMRIEPTSFSAIVDNVPYEADFDMYELGWAGMASTGTSAEGFFHSRNSNEELGEDAYSFNSNGYGNEEYESGSADEFLDEGLNTFEAEARNEAFATGVERAYLDVAYMTYNYDIVFWPHSSNFEGLVDGVADPPFATWATQVYNMYDTDQA